MFIILKFIVLVIRIIGKYIRMVQSNMRGDLVLTNEEEKPIQINILENLLVKQRMNPDDISTLLMDMVILGVQAVKQLYR